VKAPFVNYLRAKLSSMPKFFGWAAILLFLASGTLLRASDLPPSYIVDLPFAADQATPIWLGHPETPQSAFATLNLPIQPPDPEASLLVTVFFQEKEGGFLRIVWQGTQGAQVLSGNFYEGIAMNNQRSLLVSPATMTDPGALSFQCDGAALAIKRIKLEWLESRTGLASPELRDLLVTPAVGTTQAAPVLDGQANPVDPAAWRDQIVTVPITETPERIEQGVEYSVQMDNPPRLARLALKEAGLPWGQHIVVWINQKRAGLITPAVPDLLDAGFFTQADLSTGYVGWRDGSVYVPVALLKVGVNAVQFSVESDATASDGNSDSPPAGAPSSLAIKNVVLQLSYPPVAAASAASNDAPSSSADLPPVSSTAASTPPETITP
jgi:hypothetical protein